MTISFPPSECVYKGKEQEKGKKSRSTMQESVPGCYLGCISVLLHAVHGMHGVL